MIIISSMDAKTQVSLLLENYPELTVSQWTSDVIQLNGVIHIFRNACNFTINKRYEVEVKIAMNSSALPVIYDTGKAIAVSYPHRYSDGRLCLETDTYIRMRFADGLNLLGWMEEIVEPYYFSYEYFMRFGLFPFGERPHGIEGIIQTYQDLFHESDPLIVLRLMVFCVEGRYRGHIDCPCGSGKNSRKCHGQYLLPLVIDAKKNEIVSDDLKYIRKAIIEYDTTRNNKSKTKLTGNA